MPIGLYAKLCHAFSSFFPMCKAISVSAGPIFTIFAPMVDIELQMINPAFFFHILRDVVMAMYFFGKIVEKLPTPCTYRSVIPKPNGISPCEYAH